MKESTLEGGLMNANIAVNVLSSLEISRLMNIDIYREKRGLIIAKSQVKTLLETQAVEKVTRSPFVWKRLVFDRAAHQQQTPLSKTLLKAMLKNTNVGFVKRN